MTIIIISHNLEFLINFDKVYELKDNLLSSNGLDTLCHEG